ncbi:hypothetical protein B0H10DRAFT_2005612 [Mycena sp. CBHHK59/15]|nr:hypothetical protein B0H10DRAFT_2005612 [Mycena sp. CBHHK59/15]
MPPRTRGAGRVRLMALGPVNTTGLAALPVETLLEITAHLKTVPVHATYQRTTSYSVCIWSA